MFGGMKNRELHPSHQMTTWKSGIISTANSDRFGEYRSCKRCNFEQTKTVTGNRADRNLYVECTNPSNSSKLQK